MTRETEMSTISGRIATFASGLRRADVPADVWEKARRALLHNLSVAVAGGALARVPLELGARMPAPEKAGARTLLNGDRLAPAQAAFVNACLVHARAQDDVFFPGLTHVGAATTPAALAVGEDLDATGDELILAVVAGYEAAAALSDGIAPRTTAHGFRASGIYGVFGSAVASSLLLGLGREATRHAVAIAASFAAGLNQTWLAGTQEWQFQLGAAARSGLEAALIAEAGGTGAEDALEGAAGFYRAYLHDASEVGSLARDLGQVWRTREVTFKPFPVCAILQAPVTEAIRLRGEREGEDRWVRAARLTLSPGEASYPGTDERGPFGDVGGALMSASYCLAVALTEGTVTAVDLFRHREPALLDLGRRIEVISDPDMRLRSFHLEVEFRDGAATARFDADETTFNWDWDEVVANVERLRPEVPASVDLDRLVAVVAELESVAVRDLVDVCLG